MEACSGGELYAQLQSHWSRSLLEDEARFYAAEVLLGLQYLHMQGVIYR